MRLKTVILLACMCVLTSCAEVAYAQNQSPATYGNITATASDCTATPAACVSLHFPYTNTGVVGIQVTGTWTATLAAQGSIDNGANWFTVNMTPYTTSAPVSTTAANGNWQAFVGGLTDFRIRASAYTSGTAIVVINSTSAVGAGAVEILGSVTAGSASAVSQGGTPMMCDSATSGTVTAGQAQMVRCTTNGILATVVSGYADGSTAGPAGLVGSNASALQLSVVPMLYGAASGATNGNYMRAATLSTMTPATTTTARNAIGAQLSEKGSRWSVISNPAAGSQATASIAAEASVRHVVDCIAFSAASTTAPVLTALTVNVRDGATGAGTIIWTNQVVIPAGTGQNVAPMNFCGLNLVGTTNTAMTLEFSASLANRAALLVTGCAKKPVQAPVARQSR
jgi:hypothetical protein